MSHGLIRWRVASLDYFEETVYVIRLESKHNGILALRKFTAGTVTQARHLPTKQHSDPRQRPFTRWGGMLVSPFPCTYLDCSTARGDDPCFRYPHSELCSFLYHVVHFF